MNCVLNEWNCLVQMFLIKRSTGGFVEFSTLFLVRCLKEINIFFFQRRKRIYWIFYDELWILRANMYFKCHILRVFLPNTSVKMSFYCEILAEKSFNIQTWLKIVDENEYCCQKKKKQNIQNCITCNKIRNWSQIEKRRNNSCDFKSIK